MILQVMRNNKHVVKVMGSHALKKIQNTDFCLKTGNKQQSPTLKCDVLLTHPFTQTSSLCRSIITSPYLLLSKCHFGALAQFS